MEKKERCIIFARCSTSKQFTAGQLEPAKQFARANGFNDDQFIIIEYNESGYRLSEEERLGLNEMKKYIEDEENNVKCVFATEISRIARTVGVLDSIFKYLEKHQIQLKIRTPEMTLLDSNGKQSPTSRIIFSLFGCIAENEINEKLERTAYGKERCHAQGFWDGAMLPLGYSVSDKAEKNKKVFINDEDAAIVRKIFEMYSTGKCSTTSIAKELNERGFNDSKKRVFNQSRVANILKKERYCGDGVYPQIITKELFYKCAELRTKNKVTKQNSTLAEALCSKLITCPVCGYHFTSSAKIYRCFNRAQKCGCTNNVEISLALLDRLVWTYAADLEMSDLLNKSTEESEHIKEEIEIASAKLQKIEKDIAALPVQQEKLVDLYMNESISKEIFNKKKKELEEKESALQNAKDAQVSALDALQRKLFALTSDRLTEDKINELNKLLPEHTNERKSIVKKHIKSVCFGSYKFVNVESSTSVFESKMKEKKCIDISINDVYGFSRKFRYFPRWGFGSSRLENIASENERVCE